MYAWCDTRLIVTFPAEELCQCHSHPAEGKRLSWPELLVICQGSMPRNGLPILFGLNVDNVKSGVQVFPLLSLSKRRCILCR